MKIQQKSFCDIRHSLIKLPWTINHVHCFCSTRLSHLADGCVGGAEPPPECVDGDPLIGVDAGLLHEDVPLHAPAGAVLVGVVAGVLLGGVGREARVSGT